MHGVINKVQLVYKYCAVNLIDYKIQIGQRSNSTTQNQEQKREGNFRKYKIERN